VRLLSAVLALALAACGPPTLEPEEVRVDRVHCARCGMMVSRVADSAQAVFPNADTRFYDDIGCLLRDANARRPGGRLYARAAGDSGWLAVEDAWFASPAGRQTPMGYGLAAYATEAEAAGADRGFRAARWVDLVARVEVRP
jgi:copper chaperone NosL